MATCHLTPANGRRILSYMTVSTSRLFATSLSIALLSFASASFACGEGQDGDDDGDESAHALCGEGQDGDDDGDESAHSLCGEDQDGDEDES